MHHCFLPNRDRTFCLKRCNFPNNSQLFLVITAIFASLILVPTQAFTQEKRTKSVNYTLQKGDRLVNISKQYDVSVNAILEANKVADARDLQAGKTIVIPPPGTKAKQPRYGKKRRRPTDYRIRKGDRLIQVAERFGVSVDEILYANGLDNADRIREGQTLIIPVAGRKIRKAPEPAEKTSNSKKTKSNKREPAWMKRARKLARRLSLGSRRVAHRVMSGNLDKRWIRSAGRGRAPSFLRFPVPRGWVGRGWGSGPGGYHLAVDIPGKIGDRVNAAAPGLVAYANDELAGFGKVVMIVHPGGLVTLYAHNSEFKTVPGERVKRGTRIALLGSSGISRGPHVHFEVIYKGLLCDPLPLFRPSAKTKKGRPVLRKRALISWPRRGGPPKGLRCAKRRRHPEYVGKPYGWRPADWPHRYRKKARGKAAKQSKATPSEPAKQPPPAGDTKN